MIESAHLDWHPTVGGWALGPATQPVGRVNLRYRWWCWAHAIVTEGHDDAWLLHLWPKRRWWQPVRWVRINDADDELLGWCEWSANGGRLLDREQQTIAHGTGSAPQAWMWAGRGLAWYWPAARQLQFGPTDAYQRLLCLAGVLTGLVLGKRDL
jgi:hypothetical protein